MTEDTMGRENDPGTKENLGLRDDGPTLEEYLAAGYSEDSYPPEGFEPKDSPAYRDLVAERHRKKRDDAAATPDRELSEEEAAAATKRALEEQLAQQQDPPEHSYGLGDAKNTPSEG